MKLPSLLLPGLMLLLFAGCKQDFDITADYKELPVVYGLLNYQDNNHYLRIQKGYLIEGNARLAAGIPDSIYYPDILSVQLIPYTATGTQLGSPLNFTRVDGNTIGLPKDSGVFATTPNWLYTFNGNLDPAKNYQLVVRNDSSKQVFKNTPDLDDNGKGIKLVQDFAVSTPIKGYQMSLQKNSPSSRVVWSRATNASLYDLTIRFFYKEYRTADNVLLKDTFIDVPLFKSFEPDNTTTQIPPVEISSDNLLSFLASKLVASNDVYREFNLQKGMQFKLSAGGKEFARFINSQQAQGGLGSNEALPPYTNIENGAGLVSSRYFKQIDSVTLSPAGFDALSCSDVSKALRFKNKNGVICQ